MPVVPGTDDVLETAEQAVVFAKVGPWAARRCLSWGWRALADGAAPAAASQPS